MVSNMCGSNLVVQKVNYAPGIQLVIGTINCMESSFNEIVVVLRVMRNINVRMLKPVILLPLRRRSMCGNGKVGGLYYRKKFARK